jgi:hypothetical protein
VITLIREWWGLHGLPAKEDRLRRDILPAAIRETQGYRDEYRTKTERLRSDKAAKKTKARVLQLLSEHSPLGPAQVSASLGIGRSAAQMQLWRLAQENVVIAESGAYRLRTTASRTQ